MPTHRSRRFESAGTGALVGDALGRPLGACMLPVMLGALAAMLSSRDPLPFLWYGFPSACLVAWWWTVHRLKSTVVEIDILGEFATVGTAWDRAARRAGAPSAVLDVRRSADDLLATIGLDTYRLDRRDWEQPDRLEQDLGAARAAHVDSVSRRLQSERTAE